MAGIGSLPILSYGDEEVLKELSTDTSTAQSATESLHQAAGSSQESSAAQASNLSFKHQSVIDDPSETADSVQSTHSSDSQPAKREKRRTKGKTSQASGSKSGAHGIDKPSVGSQDDDIQNDVDQAIDQGLDPKMAREAVIEAKRRRAAYKAMMVLYEQGAVDADTLGRVAAPISGQELQQVAYERSIAGRCGSPVCTNSVSAKLAQQIRWTAAGDVIDRDTGPMYCGAACQQFVTQFAELLGDPMKRLKPAQREKLLVSHRPKHDGKEVAAQVNGVTTMLAEVEERNTSSSGAAVVSSVDQPLMGSSTAVEGYVPKSLKQQQKEMPPAYSISVAKPQAGGSGCTQGCKSVDAAPLQPAAGASEQDKLSGVARHITSLVEDISVPTSASAAAAPTTTIVPQATREAPAPQTMSSSQASMPTADASDQRMDSIVGALSDVNNDKPSGSNEQNLHSTDEAWGDNLTDFTADMQEFDAWMQKIPWETPGQNMQWTDGVDEDELAKIHAAAARAQSQQPAKSSLRKPRSSSPARKTVKWADESKQEFTDRTEPVPEKPVLVFTLEGAGSDMQGTLLPQSDTAEQQGNGTPGKQLAGTLEVQDAVKLRELMGEQLDSLTQISNEPASDGQTKSAFTGLPPTAGLPKGFQLWFPPAAGGIGVSIPKDTQRTSTQSGHSTPTNKAKPRFKPNVPQGKTSAQSSKPSNVEDTRAQSKTTTTKAVGSQPTSRQQPANGNAASTKATASSSGTIKTSTESTVSDTQQKKAPQTLSLRPKQPRVVMLDSVPKPEASSKPSVVVKRTQHSNGSTSKTHGLQTATPAIAATDLQPCAEVLPFEQPGSRPADGTIKQPGNGVWVIKSDPEHAKPLNQRKVQYDDWQTGQDDADQDSNASDSERCDVQAGRRQHRHGKHTKTQHDEAMDSDSDGSSYDAASDQEADDSDGNAESGNGRRKPLDKKTADRTVLYEEDDEAADEEAEMEDLKALLSEIQGDGKDSGEDDQAFDSDDDDPAYSSAFPFFGPPPAGYRVELSPFNLLWTLLGTWVTRETLIYLNAAKAGMPSIGQPSAADSQAAESVLNALPAPDAREVHARAAFAELLAPHLESSVAELKAQDYLGDIRKRFSGLLRTFTFPGPVPSLSIQQWKLLALAILRALSMFRVPGLAVVFDSPGSKGGASLSNLLEGTGFELPHLSSLVDLLLND